MIAARRRRCLVATLTAVAAPCAAQTIPASDLPDASVVVTGTRLENKTGSLLVVDAERIERLQSPTVVSILDALPGVRAYQRGGLGGSTYLSIRGGEPNFTLVLLDGVVVNDASNAQGGSFDFSQIEPGLVERIELVRGGASAIYGSNALSGAVNVRLREPARGGAVLSASTRADTHGGTKLSGQASLGWQGGGLLMALSRADTGTVDGARLQRKQTMAKGSVSAGRLEVSGFLLHTSTDGAGFAEESGGPRLAANRGAEKRRTGLILGASTLRVRSVAASTDLIVTASSSRQTARVNTPAIAPGVFDGVPAIATDTRYSRTEATAYAQRAGGRTSLAFDSTFLRETGREGGMIDLGFLLLPTNYVLARNTVGLFAEAEHRMGRGRVAVSVRTDHITGAGWQASGRTYGEVELGDEWTVGFSANRSFKMPSFYALGQPLVGNPALRPETGGGVEATVDWHRGPIRFDIAMFRARYDNLVDFDPVSFRLVNRSRTVTTGGEVRGEVTPASGVTLRGQVSHLAYAASAPLRGRPNWKGAAEVEISPVREISAFARVVYNGAQEDSSIPTGFVRTRGFTDVALGAATPLHPGIRLRIAVTNALDDRTEQTVGFPRESRSLRATLEAKL